LDEGPGGIGYRESRRCPRRGFTNSQSQKNQSRGVQNSLKQEYRMHNAEIFSERAYVIQVE